MNVFIDPPYTTYYQNELFNADNLTLNRDDTLTPFIRMRTALNVQNIRVNTADYLFENRNTNLRGDYYSFGLLDNLNQVINRKNIRLKAFVLFEPPVVAPDLYLSLPRLTELFETIYIHNITGDGYSLNGVQTCKLKKLYWPQPYKEVIEKYWNKQNRARRVVVINGNHKPKSFSGELYSKRIEVISQLKKFDFIDLYGRGWERWWSRNSMWLPYWKNRNVLMAVYRGSCNSKSELLSQYDFSLCFENMQMEGYVTEKIFDCFYAGTIPIYWGAKNIEHLIPTTAYIDYRNYQNIEELYHYLNNMPEQELLNYKYSARNFLESKEGLNYFNAINNLIDHRFI